MEEIADELRLNTQTIRNWIKGGELKAIRAGHVFRVDRADLDAMLARHAGKTMPLGIHRDVWDPKTIGAPYRRDDGTSQQSIWDGAGALTPAHKRN